MIYKTVKNQIRLRIERGSSYQDIQKEIRLAEIIKGIISTKAVFMDNFSPKNIRRMWLEQKQSRIKVMELVKDFMSDSTTEKEVIELGQVGKFLLKIGEKAEILEKRESPDCIITDGEITVGLEVERKFTNNAAQVQACNLLCKRAGELFKERFPDEKILVNIYLTNNFTYKGFQKNDLIEQIVNYVYGELKQINPEKPDFINEIKIIRHSGINFYYNPDVYVVQDLTEDALNEAIEKKEKLVEKYIENTGIDKQWLLIVVGQASPDSYEIEDLEINFDRATKFERIYILDEFRGEAIRIY